MANITTGIGTLKLYESSNFRQGIKGFIDERGIADLLWVQDNLGGKMYIAAGTCPQCGNKQLTIYMGFTSTHCLKCRYEMSLHPQKYATADESKMLNPAPETIDIEYEDIPLADQAKVAVTTDFLAETMKIEFTANESIKWPEIPYQPWYKRVRRFFKNAFIDLKNKLFTQHESRKF